MFSPRGSLLLAYVGDYFVDRIDHRLRGGEHDVVRRTRDGAIDPRDESCAVSSCIAITTLVRLSK